MKKIFTKILLGLNLLAVFSLLIAYISVYIAPDKVWFPSLFGLGFPVLFVINVFFVLLWLIINPRYLVVSLTAIFIGIGFSARYLQFSGKKIEQGDVKVLSYNVKHFIENGVELQKETADEITEFIQSQNADIICLQEVRLRKNSIFNLAQTVSNLDNINHYQYARSSTTFGSVTLTRYPIVNMGEIRFENSRNISIYTDVLIDDDTVRIFNIHLQSYQLDPSQYSIIETPESPQKFSLKEIKEVQKKLRHAARLRSEQVREIRKYIEDSPYHIILCGDFNDPPASFSYRKLRKGLDDAFIDAGSGVGRTYIGKLPSLRIDYILHSKGFLSYNFQTLDFRNSDHLPIACELVKE